MKRKVYLLKDLGITRYGKNKAKFIILTTTNKHWSARIIDDHKQILGLYLMWYNDRDNIFGGLMEKNDGFYNVTWWKEIIQFMIKEDL